MLHTFCLPRIPAILSSSALETSWHYTGKCACTGTCPILFRIIHNMEAFGNEVGTQKTSEHQSNKQTLLIKIDNDAKTLLQIMLTIITSFLCPFFFLLLLSFPSPSGEIEGDTLWKSSLHAHQHSTC